LTPNKTIWLDLPVEDAAKRMASREAEGEVANRLDHEKMPFHKAVYQAFSGIQKNASQRVKRIDARRNIAQVQSDIQVVLKSL
ncbi:MAG: dTMP kinase, partial [Ghiorsea sp.]|nr:dTMP kinase [Ghiorsea sp.]